MEIQKNITLNKGVTIFFFILLLSAIISNLYHYYINKNYDYLVTISCGEGYDMCEKDQCEINEQCSDEISGFYIKSYNYINCTKDNCRGICNSDKNICQSI